MRKELTLSVFVSAILASIVVIVAVCAGYLIGGISALVSIKNYLLPFLIAAELFTLVMAGVYLYNCLAKGDSEDQDKYAIMLAFYLIGMCFISGVTVRLY